MTLFKAPLKDSTLKGVGQSGDVVASQITDTVPNNSTTVCPPGILSAGKETAEPQEVVTLPAVSSRLSHMSINACVPIDLDEGGWEVHKNRRYGRKHTTAARSSIPPVDWNTHKAETTRTTYIGKSVRKYQASVGTGKTRFVHGFRTRSGVPYAQQSPGKVVWHRDYRNLVGRNVAPADIEYKHLVTASDGSQWIKKSRYFVILARTKHTVPEVPVYSYDDCGLENKKDDVEGEYLSLKAPKLTEDTSFVNQIPEHPVLEVASLAKRDEVMRATKVVHYTEVVSRDIDVEDLRLVADISCEANETLQKYVKGHLGRAPDDH